MATRFQFLVAGVLARTACASAMLLVATGAEAQMIDSAAAKPVPPLFQREAPLAVTFTTNLDQLRGDKGATPPWRAATLTYDSAGTPVHIPVRARTRGIWRLKNCSFPPVRLKFSGKASRNTMFDQLDEPKLVNYCRDNDDYEQYVLQELQLYRIYRLLTPISHQVRLLRVSYADSTSGKADVTRYAFITEDPGELAKRLGGMRIKTEGAGPTDFEPKQLALAFLFSYMIGNTDFSFNRLHNTELLTLPTGELLPIMYDFDFSGAVNARYATVPPQLGIRTVRERLFRGYCSLVPELPGAIGLFQQKKDSIYALYADEIGRLMNPRVVKETLAYFDEFYETIADPRQTERHIIGRCVGPR